VPGEILGLQIGGAAQVGGERGVRRVPQGVQSGAVQAVQLPQQIGLVQLLRIDAEPVSLLDRRERRRRAGIDRILGPLTQPLFRTRPGGFGGRRKRIPTSEIAHHRPRFLGSAGS
jgi:hypothetical protein